MATRIPWPGFPRGFTKSVGACVVPRTSPTAIERTSSLCTADHAPIDKTSAANASHPPKKRKLSSDTFATPETQAEVHTAPSSRANGNSTFAQPHASNKGAVKVPTTQSSLVSKLSLIGGVEVLRDLRHTLLHLSPHSSHNSLVPNQDTGLPSTSGPLDKLLSLRSTQVLSILRTELEASEAGEQLHRFRKRIALSSFFEFYEGAQDNALSFLHRDLTMRELSHNITSNQSPRLKS